MTANERSLIFIAHGSRNTNSNHQITILVNTVAGKVIEKYGRVNHAFLEFSRPSIPEVVQQQIADGMKEIVIFPYFLTNGNHVTTDIPALINNFSLIYPHIKFNILPAFGSFAGMANLIETLL